MPCYATGSAEGDARLDAQESREELTKVSRYLCEAMTLIEKNAGLAYLSNGAKSWWKKHKAIDSRRRAEESAEKRRKLDRKAALNKLSPNDRVALGLPRYGDED